MSATVKLPQVCLAFGQQTLPDEIIRWMVEQMRNGTLKPGDRLPAERQLCKQFAVSRTVVREALSQMKSEGLIVARQGQGTFVVESGLRQAFRLSDVAIREKNAQAHVLELLIAIEGAATGLAALRRTQEELHIIRRALYGMEFAISQGRLGDEEDFAFHQAIIAATHNPHFRDLNEYLEHSVRRLIRQARSNTAMRDRRLVQAVQEEHQAIYDAIAIGDSEAAARTAEIHLRNSADRLQTYLTTFEQPQPAASY